MTEASKEVGRLALRREGEWWVAYYAAPDTMDRAIKVGSLLIKLAEMHPTTKKAFMAAMQVAISDLVAGAIGKDLAWPTPPQPARD